MPLTAAERQKIYRERHPERVKEQASSYYYNNLEHSKEIRKQWMLENETYMKELRAQVIACNCGSNVRRGEYSRHCKTKKHMKHEEQCITPERKEILTSQTAQHKMT